MTERKICDAAERLDLQNLLLVAASLCLNGVTYFGTRLLMTGAIHHSMVTPLDDMVPFVPGFVLFYVLAYVQWGVVFILIMRKSRDFCTTWMSAEMIAKCFCLVIFLIYPTTLARPELAEPGTFAEKLTALIYHLDAPDNLFPSIHCLESWFCFRASQKLSGRRRAFAVVNLIMAFLVFASTVLIRQHVLADIVGGIAVTEAGIYISHLIRGQNKRRFSRKQSIERKEKKDVRIL